MKRGVFPLLAIILVTLACGVQASPTLQPTSLPGGTPSETVPLPTPSFTISVEYALLGVADAYASAGVSYAKLQNVFAIWGNIEPQPGHYQWGPLDALVLEYQQAGFTGLQMDLSALSPWASSTQPSLGNPGDPFPKSEFIDDYVSFISAVVERYDHDGIEDMPLLLYPIHDYGIEREFSGFWPGTAEEYVRLLRLAYPSIKKADQGANVLLVALLMTDIFDGNPTQAEIQQRLTRKLDFMRKSVPDMRTILAACDAYDGVDFHSLGNYTEIPSTTAWIRQELRANGCGEKPIWVGDAFPMSGLVGYGGIVPPMPFSPVTQETLPAIEKILQGVADPAEPAHSTDQAWLYAETAIGLTRKIVVSAAAGLRGINIGNLEDWTTGIPVLDKAAVPMLGASMFMGLTDTTVTAQKPGGTLPYTGQDWSKARRIGALRQAWRALSLVTEKLGMFSSVKQPDPASLSNQNHPIGIWAYQFETPSGSLWVLWYDDGNLHLPGDKLAEMSIKLPIEVASALLTFVPTSVGQTELDTQTVQAIGGSISFNLGAVPVFVEQSP